MKITAGAGAFGHRLARTARSQPVAFTLALSALMIAGDFITSVEVTFMLLYLLPITLGTWWKGRVWGLSLATICTVSATGVELEDQLRWGHAIRPFLLAWNHGGTFIVFAVIVHLTARYRLYLDSEQQRHRLTIDQLRQAERLGVVGKMAAGVAHELGTPINVIVGYADLLASESPSVDLVEKASSTILAQTQKMTRIIRGLLDFSRHSESDRIKLDLGQLMGAAVDLMLPLAQKLGLEIKIDLLGAKKLWVTGNATELEQVLLNLMMNGIQSMSSRGTLRVRLRQSTRNLGASRYAPPSFEACVEIEDQGVGIDPKDLPRIFDPFFTTKEVGKGTGLGLSISYGIVNDHGGRIEVVSTQGKGSCFSVYLPLVTA